MKPNNVAYRKCTDTSFYKEWLSFLTPFHGLANRECDVAARILEQYFRLSESIKDPDVLREVMWSKTSKNDMLKSLGMSVHQFYGILRKLRSIGFIADDTVNARFLPHKTDEPRVMLQVIFDWSSPTKPIIRNEAANNKGAAAV